MTTTMDHLQDEFPGLQNTTLYSTYDNNTTPTNWTEHDWPTPGPIFMNIYLVFRSIWSLLSFIGNLLTIILVTKFESLQTSANFLLCSLGVADLFGGLVTPLLIYHHTHLDQPSYAPVCLTETALNLLSTSGNVLSILFISVDRYIYIAHALRYHTIVTLRKTTLLLITLWIYLVSTTTILFCFFSDLQQGMPCKWSVFLNQRILAYFVLPQSVCIMCLTTGFYLAIAKIAHKQGKAVAALNQPFDTIEASINKKSWKIIKLLGTILGVYIICIVPQFCMNMTLYKYKTDLSMIKLDKITSIIFWANIWVNPIIYVWKMKDFREAFKKLL